MKASDSSPGPAKALGSRIKKWKKVLRELQTEESLLKDLMETVTTWGGSGAKIGMDHDMQSDKQSDRLSDRQSERQPDRQSAFDDMWSIGNSDRNDSKSVGLGAPPVDPDVFAPPPPSQPKGKGLPAWANRQGVGPTAPVVKERLMRPSNSHREPSNSQREGRAGGRAPVGRNGNGGNGGNGGGRGGNLGGARGGGGQPGRRNRSATPPAPGEERRTRGEARRGEAKRGEVTRSERSWAPFPLVHTCVWRLLPLFTLVHGTRWQRIRSTRTVFLPRRRGGRMWS